MRALLQRGALLVAAVEDDPDTIAGWALTEGPATVHYCFVRHGFRRMGIARTLLAPYLTRPAVTVTHAPWFKLPLTWAYRPYAAFFSELLTHVD